MYPPPWDVPGAAVQTGASPPADVPALIDVLCRLFWLAITAGDLLTEVDINPLAILGKGQGGTGARSIGGIVQMRWTVTTQDTTLGALRRWPGSRLKRVPGGEVLSTKQEVQT